jgi:hypothetical protein
MMRGVKECHLLISADDRDRCWGLVSFSSTCAGEACWTSSNPESFEQQGRMGGRASYLALAFAVTLVRVRVA